MFFFLTWTVAVPSDFPRTIQMERDETLAGLHRKIEEKCNVEIKAMYGSKVGHIPVFITRKRYPEIYQKVEATYQESELETETVEEEAVLPLAIRTLPDEVSPSLEDFGLKNNDLLQVFIR